MSWTKHQNNLTTMTLKSKIMLFIFYVITIIWLVLNILLMDQCENEPLAEKGTSVDSPTLSINRRNRTNVCRHVNVTCPSGFVQQGPDVLIIGSMKSGNIAQ